MRHRPQSGEFAGYFKKEGRKTKLLTWDGKDMGWTLHREVGRYTTYPEYDTTYAVILVQRLKDGSDQFAAGYALGLEGMIVRAETDPSWIEDEHGDADFDMSEVEERAASLADYWSQKDQEADEEEEARLREEEEQQEASFEDDSAYENGRRRWPRARR